MAPAATGRRYRLPPLRRPSIMDYRKLLRLVEQRRLAEVPGRAAKLLSNPELEPDVRARVHALICHVYCEQRRYLFDAVLHGQRAVRMARRLRDPGLMADAAVHYATACYAAGYYRAAAAACKSVVQGHNAAADPKSPEARALHLYAAAMRQLGGAKQEA